MRGCRGAQNSSLACVPARALGPLIKTAHRNHEHRKKGGAEWKKKEGSEEGRGWGGGDRP